MSKKPLKASLERRKKINIYAMIEGRGYVAKREYNVKLGFY